MRFIHLIVVATLVAAAIDVYKIKFEATVQAERVARLRSEIRRERDTIAALRAEWAQLDNPARIQELAQRHLSLKPVEPTQVDAFDHLPERPPAPASPPPDVIAGVIDRFEDGPTGSTPNGSAAEAGGVSTGPVETLPLGTRQAQ
jgi:cell division protein FtsL